MIVQYYNSKPTLSALSVVFLSFLAVGDSGL